MMKRKIAEKPYKNNKEKKRDEKKCRIVRLGDTYITQQHLNNILLFVENARNFNRNESRNREINSH